MNEIVTGNATGLLEVTRDIITFSSNFMGNDNTANRVVSTLSDLDGTFTAASTVSISSDNDVFINSFGSLAGLFHGTETSILTNAVSLIGWAIERPTSGANLGAWSGINHNDDYYIYYQDFGDIAAGESVSINFSTEILNAGAVPEPSSYAMLLGLFALGFTLNRRR